MSRPPGALNKATINDAQGLTAQAVFGKLWLDNVLADLPIEDGPKLENSRRMAFTFFSWGVLHGRSLRRKTHRARPADGSTPSQGGQQENDDEDG